MLISTRLNENLGQNLENWLKIDATIMNGKLRIYLQSRENLWVVNTTHIISFRELTGGEGEVQYKYVLI